jgi:hypothetical protein
VFLQCHPDHCIELLSFLWSLYNKKTKEKSFNIQYVRVKGIDLSYGIERNLLLRRDYDNQLT